MRVEIKLTAEVDDDNIGNGYTKDAIIKQVSKQVTFTSESIVSDFEVQYCKEVE